MAAKDAGSRGGAHREGRGHADRVSADLPDAGHHLRQPQGRGRAGLAAVALHPELPRAARSWGPPRRSPISRRSSGPSPRAGTTRARGGTRHERAARPERGRDAGRPGPTSTATSSAPSACRARQYFAWMCLVALTLACGVAAWAWQIWVGIGAAGKRTPQMWAMYITTFVFWIGIGHAGTLISAVLYLFRARWRTVDLPGRGGDDRLRGHDRGALPADPRRPHVVRLLADAVSQPALPLAELQVAAGVGRVRDLDLPDHQRGLLHRGPRARTSRRSATTRPG